MPDTKMPLQQILNLTKDQSQAIENSNSPSASNPFLTTSAFPTGAVISVPIAISSRLIINHSLLGISASQRFDIKFSNNTVSLNSGGFVNNTTYGGSGVAIPVPSEARWVRMSVTTDLNVATGAGDHAVTSFLTEYNLGSGNFAYQPAKVDVNAPTDLNATDSGSILIALPDPSNPTADVTLYQVISTPGTIDVTTRLRIEEFLIPISLL